MDCTEDILSLFLHLQSDMGKLAGFVKEFYKGELVNEKDVDDLVNSMITNIRHLQLSLRSPDHWSQSSSLDWSTSNGEVI